MDNLFKALADPSRRCILVMLWQEERRAGDVAQTFEMSRPAVSQHLNALAQAGLVTVRRQGTERWYRTDPGALAQVWAWFDSFWSDDFSVLSEIGDRERLWRNAQVALRREAGLN